MSIYNFVTVESKAGKSNQVINMSVEDFAAQINKRGKTVTFSKPSTEEDYKKYLGELIGLNSEASLSMTSEELLKRMAQEIE